MNRQPSFLLFVACMVSVVAACGSAGGRVDAQAAGGDTVAPKKTLPPPPTTLAAPSDPIAICESFGATHGLTFVRADWDPALGGPARLLVAKLRVAGRGVGPWGSVDANDWIYVCPFRPARRESARACDRRVGSDDVWVDEAGINSGDLFPTRCDMPSPGK